MKKYRIAYNPYLRETTVEEHFDQDSIEWCALGGENAPDLQKLLHAGKTIQETGLQIFKWIDDYNNKVPRQYQILFCGIEEDYQDVRVIAKKFRSLPCSEDFQGVAIDRRWESVKNVLDTLTSGFNRITELFSDEARESPELTQKLEECLKIEQTDLSVLVFGIQNSGKSTLINALIGQEILPSSHGIETALLCRITRGEHYLISLETVDKHRATVSFSPTAQYEYEGDARDLWNFLDREKAYDNPECNMTDRIRRFLEKLNADCRKRQDSDNEGDIQSLVTTVTVSVPDLQICDTDQKIDIIDCPGSGAKYLSKRHEELIHLAIQNASHAVSLYVLPFEGYNWENIESIQKRLIQTDSNRENGQGQQVDFDRSIYVLSKADSATSQPDMSGLQNDPMFQGKKVILTAAFSALKIINSRRVDPKFSSEAPNDERLFLEDASQYPDAYDKESVLEAVRERALSMVRSPELADSLVRTGVPLVSYFLCDYADRFSNVYKVECYYEALKKMLSVLEDEEHRIDQNLKEKKTELEEHRETIRNNISTECQNAYEKYSEEMGRGTKRQDVRVSLVKRNFALANEIQSRIPTWVENYSFRTEVKGDKTKKKWSKPIEGTEYELQQAILEKRTTLIENANAELAAQIDQFKGELKGIIGGSKPDEVDASEFNKIFSEIDQYKVESINNEQLKLADISISGIKDLIQRVFHRVDFYKEKITTVFLEHWDREVTEKVLDVTTSAISSQASKVCEMAKKSIGEFSPELIEEQARIDQAQEALKTFSEKEAEARGISSQCADTVKGRPIPHE